MLKIIQVPRNDFQLSRALIQDGLTLFGAKEGLFWNSYGECIPEL